MKKITPKQHRFDVLVAYRHRTGRSKQHKKVRRTKQAIIHGFRLNTWLEQKIKQGLNISIDGFRAEVILPKTMNFSSHYEETTSYLEVIRKLADKKRKSKSILNLASVDFCNLVELSTSAALVLTAEISRWDDGLRRRLKFNGDKWNPQIISQLYDLGYFHLFKNNPFRDIPSDENYYYDAKLVRYVKGKCGDSKKARTLKKQITSLVGDEIKKWTFLHSGLTEAVTNVTHHAYPEKAGYSNRDKNWYLSGSYDEKQKVLKIVFYDQGIGIPRSLPASKIWEKLLVNLSKIPMVDRKKDAVLLKAAVEIDRTSTEKNDRGKGLQDLLEFIKKRDNGYLSILSQKGMYKYSLNKGKMKVKTESFATCLLGTLIIWSVSLDQK